MNPFKNEHIIKIGGRDILLRPTFENIAALEEHVGALGYIAALYSGALSGGDSRKKIAPLTTTAKIIYYSQAARKTDSPELRELSLEEIWDLVQDEGLVVTKDILAYLAKITAGNKSQVAPSKLSEREKKS